jgi:hypothetical protein
MSEQFKYPTNILVASSFIAIVFMDYYLFMLSALTLIIRYTIEKFREYSSSTYKEDYPVFLIIFIISLVVLQSFGIYLMQQYFEQPVKIKWLTTLLVTIWNFLLLLTLID